MQLSVVVPTQNRLHLLKKFLLPSLQQNEGFKYEVIVVDYMSTDNTKDYLIDLKQEHAKLRGIRVDGEAGFNLSKTRNIGIEAAKGDVIFTLDADVEVRRTDSFQYWYNHLLTMKDYCVLRTVGGGNLFFKRELWAKCGGYPNFFKNHGYEDWVFMHRSNKFGGYLYKPTDFSPAKKHDNKWFGTVKPIRNFQTRQVENVPQRPGYIDVKSNWEDNSQDTVSLWTAYEKNPEKFTVDDPLPEYYEI